MLVAVRELPDEPRWPRGLHGPPAGGRQQEPSYALAATRRVLVSPGVDSYVAACCGSRQRACSCNESAHVQELWASENRVTSDELSAALSPLLMLQDLRLSGNCIAHLPALPWLPHLTALSLSDNPLRSLGALRLQPRLARLDITFCHLKLGPAIAALQGLTRLTALQLNDNRDSPDEAAQTLAALAVLPWLREVNHEDVCARSAAHAGFALTKQNHRILSTAWHGAAGRKAACVSSRARVRAWQVLRDRAAGVLRDGGGGYCRSTAWQLQRCCAGGVGGSADAGAAALDLRVKLQAAEIASSDTLCRQLLCGLANSAHRDAEWSLERLCDALTAKQQHRQACRVALLSSGATSSGVFWQNQEHAKRASARRAAAARVLQSAWRASMKSRARRRWAATLLQAIARGAAVRRRGELHTRRGAAQAARNLAACRIQAACRGHVVRARLSRARATLQHGACDWNMLEHDDLGLDAVLAAGAALGLLEDDTSHPEEAAELGLAAGSGSTTACAGAQARQDADSNIDAAEEPLAGCFGAVAPNLLRRFNSKRNESQQRSRPPAAAVTTVKTSHTGGASLKQGDGAARPAVSPSHVQADNVGDMPPRAAPSPSPVPIAAASTALERKARRVQQVQQEWGFADAATAEAYLRRRRRQAQGGQAGAAARRAADRQHSDSTDPLARLEQLRGDSGMWPAVRERGRRRGEGNALRLAARPRHSKDQHHASGRPYAGEAAPAPTLLQETATARDELPALRRPTGGHANGDLAALIDKVVHTGGAAS